MWSTSRNVKYAVGTNNSTVEQQHQMLLQLTYQRVTMTSILESLRNLWTRTYLVVCHVSIDTSNNNINLVPSNRCLVHIHFGPMKPLGSNRHCHTSTMVLKTHTLVNKTTTLTTAHWRLHNTNMWTCRASLLACNARASLWTNHSNLFPCLPWWYGKYPPLQPHGFCGKQSNDASSSTWT